MRSSMFAIAMLAFAGCASIRFAFDKDECRYRWSRASDATDRFISALASTADGEYRDIVLEEGPDGEAESFFYFQLECPGWWFVTSRKAEEVADGRISLGDRQCLRHDNVHGTCYEMVISTEPTHTSGKTVTATISAHGGLKWSIPHQ